MSQQCRDLVQCHNSSEPVSPRRASGGSSLQLSMVLWCMVFLGYRESCVRISASTHRYVQLSVTETCVVLLQSRSSRLLWLRALSAQVWLQFGFLLTAHLVHPLANVLEIQATLVHATTDQLSLHALHDLQDQWDSLLWEHSAMSPLCDCLFFARDWPWTVCTLLALESSTRPLNCPASSVYFLQEARPERLSRCQQGSQPCDRRPVPTVGWSVLVWTVSIWLQLGPG